MMVMRMRPLAARTAAVLGRWPFVVRSSKQQSLSTLSYVASLHASIPPSLSSFHHMVHEFEEAVRLFKPKAELETAEFFANNHLKLANIDVVGFDYDYTLCHYTEALQHLIYSMARDVLVNKLRYPSGVSVLQFDKSFAIRGLTIDKERGLLCKISSHQQLCNNGVYRGRQRLSRAEIMTLYGGSRHVPVHHRDNNMEPLNDLFSVAHACLFADVVQYLIDQEIEYEPIAVVEDIQYAISQVHLNGKMHKAVEKDITKYIEPNPSLRPLLERLRSSGKETFLCTNSTFAYVDTGLRYMLGDDWRDLFDVVIARARKPEFYTRHHSFRLLDPDTKHVQWQAVRELKSTEVYTQGSLHELARLKGWGGNRVLYIGDSLFSDLVEPARTTGWRTGAIIRELEDEIKVQSTPEYQMLAFQINALEELMRRVQNELRTKTYPESMDQKHVFVSHLVDVHQQLQNSMESMINANFGSVFRADHYPSQFAFFVQRYVDIYSARLETLLTYPDSHTFYPERLALPHEQQIRPTFHRNLTAE